MTLAIDAITTHFVSIPLAEPIKHPFMGARSQYASVVVEVRCSDGCTGVGYISLENVRITRAVESIVLALEPALKGKDPLQRAFIHDWMWNLTVDALHDGATNLALAAIDMALWDIAGKQAGQPVWKLMGGYRSEVPAYHSGLLWRHHSIERLESDAANMAVQGWRAMKMRMGGGRSLAEDMERARVVRRAVGPDVALMVDALWGSTPNQGVRMARALVEVDCAWLEEPVREGDFAGLAQVRSAQALPIAAGERISRLGMVQQLAESVDHAILDISHIGGLTPALKAAAILDVHNLPVSSHAYSVLSSHFVAALRTGAWVEHFDWWDALFVDPPQVSNGMLQMRETPGFGLEPDRQTLRRYSLQ